MTRWVYDDGGRAAAGYRGDAGDCVVRAVAIATVKPYQEVYDTLHHRAKEQRVKARSRKRFYSSPREGVLREVFQPYLESLGWRWVPTMKVGQGCTVHLRAEELPRGRLIAKVSRHLAVVDGVIHDTADPSREGTRCVYGYFLPPEAAAL